MRFAAHPSIFPVGLILLFAALLGPCETFAMQRRGLPVRSTPQGRFVQVRHVGRAYGMSLRQPEPDGPLLLSGQGRRLEFYPESRRARFDGVTVWLNVPLTRVRRHWALSEIDLFEQVEPFLHPHRFLQQQGHRTVVLDPGHGGRDTGARGSVTVEKALTLEVALAVAERLRAAGHQVRLTRTRDEYVELVDRGTRAADLGADLFVSLHFNAGANAEARGIETYVLPPPGLQSTSGASPDLTEVPGNRFQGASRVLGFTLQRHLLDATQAEDRGLKQARFVVLRNAPSAAALVELGFLSNPGEEALILSPTYRQALADGLSSGIADYLRMVKQAQLLARP